METVSVSRFQAHDWGTSTAAQLATPMYHFGSAGVSPGGSASKSSSLKKCLEKQWITVQVLGSLPSAWKMERCASSALAAVGIGGVKPQMDDLFISVSLYLCHSNK